MRFRKIVSLSLLLVFMSVPVIAYTQRNNLYDWYRLYNYRAPDNVAKLAADTTMLPNARRLFYVNHPAVEDKAAFNKHCRSDEMTIVLGCFIEHNGVSLKKSSSGNGSGSTYLTQGIYLLSVSDSRLFGIEQVTAAHETLHAAYARLSKGEREEVDSMTSKAFNALNDQRVKDIVELYRKQDPKVVPNELHSILATEVRDLPDNLETYYKRYFSDRSKVVGYSEQYEQAFTDRKNQVQEYDAQLTSLGQQIKDLQASLLQQSNSLQAKRSQLDAMRSSNQIAAYNAAVPGFNQGVSKYNNDVDKLTQLIDQYNEIVPKRNEIANEESDLAKAIDSRTNVPARQ